MKYSFLIFMVLTPALAGSGPSQAAAQQPVSVTARVGWYRPSTFLRFIPESSPSGGDERTFLAPSAFAGVSANASTPLNYLKVELGAFKTIQSVLRLRELRYQDCGEECVRGTDVDVRLADAGLSWAALSLVGTPNLDFIIKPSAVVGVGVRRYSFAQDQLGDRAGMFGPDETKGMFQYGVRLAFDAGPFTLQMDAQRIHSGIRSNIRSEPPGVAGSIDIPQRDLAIQIGVKYSFRR